MVAISYAYETTSRGRVSAHEEAAILARLRATIHPTSRERLHSPAPATAARNASLPSWRYRGFESFPAMFFGAQNGTNTTFQPLEPASNLELITKHQLAGYGSTRSV